MARTPKPSHVGPLAWALCVVSSADQADTLPHQQEWAESEATKHGWRLSSGNIRRGVASGKDGPRRIVRDLLIDLRALEPEMRPEWLLMIRADRLGRGSIIDSQIVLRDLRELGVKVWTRDAGEVRLDSATDELIVAAKAATARIENEGRIDKALGVYRRKRAAGQRIGNRMPYGLRMEGGKILADRERARVVREAFKLRLQGQGYDLIGQRLATFAPRHTFKKGTDHVVSWTPNRVRGLLDNRSYIGPIIDEATFARAQRVASVLAKGNRSRDARRRNPWPLSGSVRCYCGLVVIGTVCGSEPRRYRYYACRARWNHEDGRIRLINAIRLEEQFVALLGRLRASPQLVERYRKRAAAPVSPRLLGRSLQDFKTQLSEVARKREKVWGLYVNGKVRGEDVQEQLDLLSAERDDLTGRIAAANEQLAIAKAAANRQHDVAALISRAAQIFQKARTEEQNAIARTLALELGGLVVDEKGALKVGTSPKTTS